MHSELLILALFANSVLGNAILSSTSPPPSVTLPYAKFQGKLTGNVTQFLGMPFAQPPVGNLRFRRPQLPNKLPGVQQAVEFGAACPQLALSPIPFFNFTSNYSAISEDCLTINVVKPTKPASHKLPVIFWIHGGAFEIGDSTDTSGLPMVVRAIALEEPVIFVTANHRLNAFGFLGGREVFETGQSNIGLYDQRLALQWVQDYIALFGGDPHRVSIFGPSAGGISVGLHLVFNDGYLGNPLFQGAIMQSGSLGSAATIPEMQSSYDKLVQDTNCTQEKNTLDCLRGVPYDDIVSAISLQSNIFSYSSVSNTWKPVVDGSFLKRDPLCAATKGLFAKVPMIAGDDDDEGTVFSLSTLNVTTDDQFEEYAKTYLVKLVTPEQLKQVAEAYPSDPAAGSPFGTGSENALTSQYKRLAAIQGDLIFQGPRRLLLESAQAARYTKTWGYASTRFKAASVLGASHGADLSELFALNSTDFYGVDAIINFANTFDPNVPLKGHQATSGALPIFWPQWSSSNAHPLYTFIDPSNVTITSDTYRTDPIKLLIELTVQKAEKSGVC